MKFNPKGLLVTAAYVLLLILALRTRSVPMVDFAERMMLWTLLALMIVATITSMIRHRRCEPLGQDAAFHEIGRSLSVLVNHF